MLSGLLCCSGLTDTLGPSGARLKAVVALAAVASHYVDTAAVLADAGLGAALVQVCRDTETSEEHNAACARTPSPPVLVTVTHPYIPLRPVGAACQAGRCT